MRFMDPMEKVVLTNLVRMAGDPLLVEHALRALSVQNDAPSIEDVMRFIVEHRDDRHASRAERNIDEPPWCWQFCSFKVQAHSL